MRAAVVVMCFVVTAAAGAAGRWTHASSPNFELYTLGSEAQARESLQSFERIRTFFIDFLKLAPRADVPVRLILFNGETEFAPYRPNRTAGAFYQVGFDRDYIVLKSFDRRLYPVVVHEYAHLIFRHSGARYPLWLNEGLADFFSTVSPDGDAMTIGSVPMSRVAYYVQSRTPLLDLERLFAVGHLSPEYGSPEHVGLFYFQSWALTHMLLTDERYRSGSGEFLRSIATGASSAPTLERAFGRSLATIARDLNGYVARGEYRHLIANVRLAPVRAAIASTKVGDFEAELMKAALLGSMAGRDADARDAFTALAAVRPDDLELIEAIGFFEMWRNRRNEARRHFARAIELGSRSPAVYRDYAALDPSKAGELLETAVSLAPSDLDLRVQRATWLLGQGRAQDAVTTLAAAKSVPREAAFSVFRLMADAYLQLGRFGEAKSAAARVTEYAEPGEQLRQAQLLQARVDEAFAARE